MGTTQRTRRAAAPDPRVGTGLLLRTGLLVVLGLVACSDSESSPAEAPAPRTAGLDLDLDLEGVEEWLELPYVEEGAVGRRQTLDLFLPEGVPSPALVAFVHGGFWTLDDDRPSYRIGAEWAATLTAQGYGVALLRYRLAPEFPHPAPTEDVAAGLSFLLENGERFGYDAKRLVVAGHSAGGHLALLTALDGRYLESHGHDPSELAGVVSVSGIVDLAPPTPPHVRAFGEHLEERTAASPIEHVEAPGPRMLLVSGAEDFPGYARESERFARLRKEAGHEADVRILEQGDHFELARIDGAQHPTARVLLPWLRGEELPPQADYRIRDRAQRQKAHTWQNPEWMSGFRTAGAPIDEHPVSARFARRLDFFFGDPSWRDLDMYGELARATSFEAIGLFDYVESLDPADVGEGEFLVMTNQRDQQLVYRREEIEAYRPVLVVGVGDVRNLFSITVAYRAAREYSWIDPEHRPPNMARPLGAFLYFLEPPPPELDPPVYAPFSYMPHGFRWSASDPYASIRDLPRDLYEVMTWRNGCVYCHTFRETGTRSFHTLMRDATPRGGFALPLTDYAPDVWKRFVFQPYVVAEMIGVSPNVVSPDAAPKLHALVEAER